MGGKQADVIRIQLQHVSVLMGGKGKRRLIDSKRRKSDPYVLKPVERELKVGKPQTLPQPCIFEALVLRIQLRRYGLVYHLYLTRLKRIRYILGHVHLVHVHNSPLQITGSQEVVVVHKGLHNVRHTAYQKIPVKGIRKLIMQIIRHRGKGFHTGRNSFQCRLAYPTCPAKLLKIKGIQGYFLQKTNGKGGNIGYLKPQQRARKNVIVVGPFKEHLDPGEQVRTTLLDLVEEDEGLSGLQFFPAEHGKT